MKKLAFLYLFLALCSKAVAQATIVAADRLNVAYEGIDNELTVAAENCSCSDLSLVTDFGELIPDERPCNYKFRANGPGKAHLTLKKKEGNTYREIGKVTYRIKEFPRPIPELMGKHSGNFKLAQLKVQRGITANVKDMDIYAAMPLKSYRIEVVRGNTLIFSCLNSSNSFDPKAVAFFKTVLIGDKVLFSDIQCIYLNGRLVELESFSLVID